MPKRSPSEEGQLVGMGGSTRRNGWIDEVVFAGNVADRKIEEG